MAAVKRWGLREVKLGRVGHPPAKIQRRAMLPDDSSEEDYAPKAVGSHLRGRGRLQGSGSSKASPRPSPRPSPEGKWKKGISKAVESSKASPRQLEVISKAVESSESIFHQLLKGAKGIISGCLLLMKGGFIMFLPDGGGSSTRWEAMDQDDINEHGCKYYLDGGLYNFVDPMQRRFYYEEGRWLMGWSEVSYEIKGRNHFQRIEVNERTWEAGKIRGFPFLAPDGDYWYYDQYKNQWEHWLMEEGIWVEGTRCHGLRLSVDMRKKMANARKLMDEGHNAMSRYRVGTDEAATEKLMGAMSLFQQANLILDDIKEEPQPEPQPEPLEESDDDAWCQWGKEKKEEESYDDAWGQWGKDDDWGHWKGKKKKTINERCRYHEKGMCKKGENCLFSHDGQAPPSEKPWQPMSNTHCKYFAKQGWCKNGEWCAFFHHEEDLANRTC